MPLYSGKMLEDNIITVEKNVKKKRDYRILNDDAATVLGFDYNKD